MPNIGFWNVGSLTPVETDERDIAGLAAGLAAERALDVLLLIECGISSPVLLAAFDGSTDYYPIPCGDRFKVLARFDPTFMELMTLPVPSDRYDIWHLTLPLQLDVLLAVIHGLDKRNHSPAGQEMFLEQVAETLSLFERQVGHERSIVLGDYNANPFESPVASVRGMNAVMSRDIARRGPRIVRGQRYPYFYNPMWNAYGDESRGTAPATYYYRGSDPHELYWHMLDQVLIRPSLMSGFDLNGLEIVTAIQGVQLRSTRGIPAHTRASDHLPVVFQLNLSS